MSDTTHALPIGEMKGKVLRETKEALAQATIFGTFYGRRAAR
jgi:hypothetical protein